VDVLFLDANVLFSAAYRRRSGLARLWALGDATLVTSGYAVEETRRNLETSSQERRLAGLLRSVRLVPEAPERTLPEDLQLPDKDQPILQAAIAAGATHLLTGDVTHFGPHYARTVAGVLIDSPGGYLRRRDRPEPG